MNPKKYKKKPVEVEAIQWTRENTIEELKKFFNGAEAYLLPEMQRISIKTLEGTMIAEVGDYIIKGVQGEFYPCKPDIFEQTYEEVKEDNSKQDFLRF